MRRDARFDRYEIFAAAAAVGAHASSPEGGFRHRDVKFLIELFSNWVETSLGASVLAVQNTQVARYLENLAADGYARKVSRKGRPSYRLTRLGLIELVSRMVGRNYLEHPAHFYFLYYFIKNYRPRIEELVKREGKLFPLSFRLELEALLDVKALVSREMAAAKRELSKLDARIRDALSASAFIAEGLRKKKDLLELVTELEKVNPYELNSQKPLSQLIGEIPPDMRQWELEVGNKERARDLFGPQRDLLAAYLGTLTFLGR